MILRKLQSRKLVSLLSKENKMTETLSLRAKIEQSPMGAYQWMIVVMAAIMNLLDGFDVLALAFTATAIRGNLVSRGLS